MNLVQAPQPHDGVLTPALQWSVRARGDACSAVPGRMDDRPVTSGHSLCRGIFRDFPGTWQPHGLGVSSSHTTKSCVIWGHLPPVPESQFFTCGGRGG